MKVMSLNTWGGRAGKEALIAFFREHAPDTDIFCLQEIWSAAYADMDAYSAGGRPIDHAEILTQGYQEISKACPDHEPYFAPHYRENYGLMMLVRKSLSISEVGEVYVYREKGYNPAESGDDLGNHARNIQYASIQTPAGAVTVINFHGLWNGKGKGDCEERLEQSRRICAFLSKLTNPYILVGDFNLLPTTESLKILEDCGTRNLVTEYGITSTRSSHYEKDIKFADYALVSAGITVNDFRVLPDEVSDHLPLLLDFELS